MHVKRNLSFSALLKKLSAHLKNLPEHRQMTKVTHSIHDVFMSGFAMMHFQDSSLLQFQRNLEEKRHQNNLRNIFNVQSIPKDTQMRDVIDEVDSKHLEPIFDDFFAALQRGKHLEQYRFLGNRYLVSLDGSGYFGSDKICCPGCLTKENKDGKVRYEHQILQAAMMHPDMKQVIPLVPEEVKNTDGTEKQDCEINAAKRLLKKIRQSHPKLCITIVGDDLYSKQPFIELVKVYGMNYILVAKPSDHKILMEEVAGLRKLEGAVSRLEVIDKKGRKHIYEWINEVPLNGNKDSVMTNYFEYRLIDKGKIGYHNGWVTDIPINKGNIEELVRGGRCRWKIENETFNTLKNQGYHIEHNFGHGSKNLSMIFFLLDLLAFFTHQILELTDVLYQKCRKVFGSKRNLWDHLRIGIRLLIFPDWEGLLLRVLNPDDFD